MLKKRKNRIRKITSFCIAVSKYFHIKNEHPFFYQSKGISDLWKYFQHIKISKTQIFWRLSERNIFILFYACFCSEYKLCSRRSVIVMLYPLLIVLDIFLKNISLPSWSCKFNLCQFTFFCHFDNKLLFQASEKRVSNHPTSFTWSLELLNSSCYIFAPNISFDN